MNVPKLTWLIVGDAAKIQPQLADIGLPVEYRGFDPEAVEEAGAPMETSGE